MLNVLTEHQKVRVVVVKQTMGCSTRDASRRGPGPVSLHTIAGISSEDHGDHANRALCASFRRRVAGN